MADINLNHNQGPKRPSRNYDNLEQILAGRPKEKAANNTADRVMARISALSAIQVAPVTVLNKTLVEPTPVKVKYSPPPVTSLPDFSEDVTPRQRRFNFYLFAMAWIGACLAVGALVWALVLNPILEGGNWSWLLKVQEWVLNLVDGINNFFIVVGPFLPTIVSVTVGVSLMLIIFRSQQRQNWSN